MILEIILPLFKRKTRKDFHSKLGTMTCEFGKDDAFFYWHMYTDRFNKNKHSVSLWIEGSPIKPDQLLLEKSYELSTTIKDYTQITQQELDSRLAFKKIDLNESYKVNEIDFSLDGKLEIEYLSDEDNMVSVIFKDKTIEKIELY